MIFDNIAKGNFGRIRILMFGLGSAEHIKAIRRIDVNPLLIDIGVGGSVAHIITKFDVLSGCYPIIFVGQNFHIGMVRFMESLLRQVLKIIIFKYFI